MVDHDVSGKFTAEAIRQRLGSSSTAMPADERFGARAIGLIREAGIVRLEVCGHRPPPHYDHRDTAQVSEIVDECRKQGVSIVSVHGPNLPYDSPYEVVRRAVVDEATAAARAAEKMGASVFVCHFNTNERSAKTAREMLDRLEGCVIKLTIENTMGRDLKDFSAFVNSIGSDRFGMTVDIGHTRDEDGVNPFIKKERARETMAICEDRLLHLHLHDFTDHDHNPPFDGNIQWDEVFAALRDMGYAGVFMFEVGARISPEDALKKIASFPDDFVARYGGTHARTDAA